MVEEDGFEPSKSVTTDLQSAPFGRSGTPPYSVMSCGGGAGGRIRTPDLLITNQLLYRLSYTSVSAATILLYHSPGAKSSPKIQFFAAKQSGSRPTGQGAAVYSPSGPFSAVDVLLQIMGQLANGVDLLNVLIGDLDIELVLQGPVSYTHLTLPTICSV